MNFNEKIIDFQMAHFQFHDFVKIYVKNFVSGCHFHIFQFNKTGKLK